MSAVDRRRATTAVILATCGASLGGFMFGFDTAVVNGTVDAVEREFAIGPALLGTIVAAALFGAAVGAFTAGRVTNRLGRRTTMFLAGALFLATSVLSALAHTGTELAVWRLLGGVGVGTASVVGPLYIAEIAPAQLRGRLASAQQMSIVLGIFAALVCNASLVGAAGGADQVLGAGLPAWRWMFLVGAVPSLAYALAAVALPESPRYLVALGRDYAARRVLQRLHRIPEPQAEHDIAAIAAALNPPNPASPPDLANPASGGLSPERTMLRRLPRIIWIGMAIAALQALVGIDVIFYYSTSLWAQVGFGDEFSFWLSAFTSLVNVVATTVAIALIDRIGRRRLLLGGSIGMTGALTVMAVGLSQAHEVGDAVSFTDGWGVVTLLAANVFVVAFAVSWGPVVWVLLGEMFPTRLRAQGASLAACANWVAGILVNLTFPTLRELSVPGSYSLYACFAAASFALVFIALPETGNRPLEEITDNH
ncbi:sugar porter family MFS transporter [Sciscionella marina]|uniref:sugar porter family MFS transporter n=1 Tax=Sciscionella marina TaxID=508770 RepID=UPI0003610AF7|nr:sugar porter family MFS transporter [Sciscionella marina]